MKTITLQTNPIPVRRLGRPYVTNAGRSLATAIISILAGVTLTLTVFPSGDHWDKFVNMAKTLSTARNQPVPSCDFQPPPVGIWTLNSY